MNFRDFRDINGYATFRQGALVLTNTLSEFFSVNVELNYKPLQISVPNYKISENPKRNTYIINENEVLLITDTTTDDKGTSYLLGITLKGNKIGTITPKKTFNDMASAISNAITESYRISFRNTIILLNDNLIKRFISKFVSKGYYNSYKIFNIIEQFINLRSTTFEGKYFSSGLIITKSLHEYRKDANYRSGILMKLYTKKSVFDKNDTRYWYLVNGYTTFYMTDLKNVISSLFIYSDNDTNYVNQMILKKALKGGDILFRVNNGKELSIITAKGIEFINQENVWRFRDYNLLRTLVCKEVNMDDSVYEAILYYVLYCSKHDVSSIIWIPQDTNKIKELTKTQHSVSRTTFKVTDRNYEGLIMRLLSSDGATVIAPNGDVKHYGCIVDMNEVKDNGPKGTGESAASILAKNGVAFKISQDGTIKVFLNNKKNGSIKF